MVLGLTPRHIRRLMERVEQAGDQGLAHRGRGTPSNRRIPEPVKAKALRLYAQRYGDFGPTLAAEKLAECHGITISAETVRGWLRDAGIDHFTRRRRPHRAWRERKAHVGELVQLDGSHHDWFEGRGAQLGQLTDKVDHWRTSDQKQRWVASALSFIEPRLRRIKGYRHLPQLRVALQAKSGKAERGEGTHIA